jgi:Flp pilus assembly protein CpaB
LRRGLLAAAIVVAGAFYFWSSPSSDTGDAGDGQDTVVLMANRYIPALTAIKPEWVRFQTLPKAALPPGALARTEELRDSKGRLRFLSAVALPEGQVLSRTLLQEMDKSHGLSSLLEPGQVAISFAVDAVHGVGGWVQPGDRVAIFVTPVAAAKNTRLTKLLFPVVTVLAVDRARLGQEPGGRKPADEADAAIGAVEAGALTVLLNPIQAASLIEARELGTLTVVLRCFGDDLPWNL